ncbi:hypothetical protein [Paracidovorax sp. MALMAid1276]|uniref:hypothetical protein n=1 Tax=Paracidovorax sp. MALMAid1276 TaxID=3411631 RepID=UPI003B9A53F7
MIMISADEIHESVIEGRYYYFLLLMLLIALNWGLDFSRMTVVIVVSLSLMVVLLANRLISSFGIGWVAIVQMVSIVGMIGVYDYFSSEHDRLNFALNFAAGFSCALSCYGSYFAMLDKR